MAKQQIVLPTRKCIYCLLEKKSNAFNREHVIPQLMGHFENGMTIGSVCSECNSYFGNHVDPVLAEDSYEAILRASSGIKPPTVVDVLRWERINLTIPGDGWWGGARLKLAWRDEKMMVDLLPQIGFRRKSTNKYDFYTYSELGQIEDWHDLSEKNFKIMSMTEEHEIQLKNFCKEKFGSDIPFKSQSEPIPAENAEIEVEMMSRIDDLIRRAICKIAFNYLAKILGPSNHEILLHSRFDALRSFVRSNKQFDRNLISVKIGNQYSILKMAPKIGVRAHLIVLEHSEDNALHCRFSPYDHFHYDITLAQCDEKILEPAGHVFFYGASGNVCQPLGIR